MLIDAHQHFWNLADRAGQWPPATLAAPDVATSPTIVTPSTARAVRACAPVA